MNLRSVLLLAFLLLASSVHGMAGPQALSEDYRQVTSVTQLEQVTAPWEFEKFGTELEKVSLDGWSDFQSQNHLFLRHQHLLAVQVQNLLTANKFYYAPAVSILVHSTTSRTTEDEDSAPQA